VTLARVTFTETGAPLGAALFARVTLAEAGMTLAAVALAGALFACVAANATRRATADARFAVHPDTARRIRALPTAAPGFAPNANASARRRNLIATGTAAAHRARVASALLAGTHLTPPRRPGHAIAPLAVAWRHRNPDHTHVASLRLLADLRTIRSATRSITRSKARPAAWPASSRCATARLATATRCATARASSRSAAAAG
jgi:hypothetical protein